MYSKYERQKDKRTYVDRKVLYKGAQYLYPPDRITPKRKVQFQEGGMPQYEEMEGGEAPAESQPEEVEVEEE